MEGVCRMLEELRRHIGDRDNWEPNLRRSMFFYAVGSKKFGGSWQRTRIASSENVCHNSVVSRGRHAILVPSGML